MQHQIQINASADGYGVTGAATIENTARPIQDAALALKAAGAADFDTLLVSGPDVPTFIAQTLAAILKPRPAPLRSEVGRILRAQARF